MSNQFGLMLDGLYLISLTQLSLAETVNLLAEHGAWFSGNSNGVVCYTFPDGSVYKLI